MIRWELTVWELVGWKSAWWEFTKNQGVGIYYNLETQSHNIDVNPFNSSASCGADRKWELSHESKFLLDGNKIKIARKPGRR